MSQYEGGYVHAPKIGLHKNVIVLDFRNLYPSIIVTHNIDPTTLDKPDCMNKIRVPGFKHYFCQDRIAPVPERIKKILEARWEIKKKLAKKYNAKLAEKEKQLKLQANIAYGYFGYPKSSYYSIPCAESISAFGRHYLQMIISEAGKQFEVIYGDTDSVFITGSMTKAKTFVKKMNEILPGIIKLEYRGMYKKGLFVTKKSGLATKKKYALIDNKGKLLVRGFEMRREDWCKLAKSTQEKILKYVLTGDKKKAISVAKKTISDLRKRKVKLDDLIISVQMTKPIDEYAAKSAHVEVGKHIGAREGDMIKYIITNGDGELWERARTVKGIKIKDVDIDYYINKQVLPSAMRVLKMFEVKEEDLL